MSLQEMFLRCLEHRLHHISYGLPVRRIAQDVPILGHSERGIIACFSIAWKLFEKFSTGQASTWAMAASE